MALRQIRVLAQSRRARRINRAPPLRRPSLVLSTFSLPHHLRSVPASSFPLLPPLAPSSCSSPANVARALMPVSPSWMPCPCPLWRPQLHAVARLAQRCWVFAVHSPKPSAETFRPLWCISSIATFDSTPAASTLARPRASSPFEAAQHPLEFPRERRTSSIPHRPTCQDTSFRP